MPKNSQRSDQCDSQLAIKPGENEIFEANDDQGADVAKKMAAPEEAGRHAGRGCGGLREL